MTRGGAPEPLRCPARTRSRPRLCLGAWRHRPRPSDVKPLPGHGRWSGRLPQAARSLSRPRPHALQARATFPRAGSTLRQRPRSHPRQDMIALRSADRQLGVVSLGPRHTSPTSSPVRSLCSELHGRCAPGSQDGRLRPLASGYHGSPRASLRVDLTGHCAEGGGSEAPHAGHA
jgi:hypothetical protein